MRDNDEKKEYSFTAYFYKIFKERTGFRLTDEDKMYILETCKEEKGHTKVDNKGRYSEYITMRLHNSLWTIVIDANTDKIITIVKETHERKAFEKL